MNQQRAYHVIQTYYALRIDPDHGPGFGIGKDLWVNGDYKYPKGDGRGGQAYLVSYDTEGVADINKELFPSRYFNVDEYEVYKLE